MQSNAGNSFGGPEDPVGAPRGRLREPRGPKAPPGGARAGRYTSQLAQIHCGSPDLGGGARHLPDPNIQNPVTPI